MILEDFLNDKITCEDFLDKADRNNIEEDIICLSIEGNVLPTIGRYR